MKHEKIKKELCDFKDEMDDFYYDAISRTNPTDEQKKLLEVASLSISELPKTCMELNQMIWKAYKAGLDTNGQGVDFARERNFIMNNKIKGKTVFLNFDTGCFTIFDKKEDAERACKYCRKDSFAIIGSCGENVGVEKPGYKELLSEIANMADCQIPHYAYGDNQAACEMASRLNDIQTLCNSL